MELADYAVGKNDFTKREYPEVSHPYRDDFQRDRDRIVHSKAFRRLEYKTQVFVNHLGDSYRTRLTHSIEVSQIARTVARTLNLNEDLTETLALAHDLGHPPFGHAGERALHRIMRDFGGFDHNEQTLRLVCKLEERYPDFNGLNLTSATLNGLQKHKMEKGKSNTLESQLVDLCDEIAYHNHDLDDGIDGGYLSPENLLELTIWSKAWSHAKKNCEEAASLVKDDLTGKERRKKIQVRFAIRWLIDYMVSDLISQTLENIKKFKIASLDDVVRHDEYELGKIVAFSDEVAKEVHHLKRFLFIHLYRHPEVVSMNKRAEEIIKRLFAFFSANPDALPTEFQERAGNPEDSDDDDSGSGRRTMGQADGESLERTVGDFISGMTDRYALFWNKKILGID